MTTTNLSTDDAFTITLPGQLVQTISSQIADRIVLEVAAAMQPKTSPWMTVDEVADYARMTSQAVRDAVKHGHLKVHRTSSGRLRFRIEDIEAFLRGAAA